MTMLAVTTMGLDRPGIIAAVTGAILERGGNVEDATMTILGGQFTTMMLVAIDADAQALEDALLDATRELDLAVHVREVAVDHATAPPTSVLTVYGTDQPGLIHGVTSVLAAHDVNVTDLESRILDGETDIYAMVYELTVPDAADADELVARLQEALPGCEVRLADLDPVTL